MVTKYDKPCLTFGNLFINNVFLMRKEECKEKLIFCYIRHNSIYKMIQNKKNNSPIFPLLSILLLLSTTITTLITIKIINNNTYQQYKNKY